MRCMEHLRGMTSKECLTALLADFEHQCGRRHFNAQGRDTFADVFPAVRETASTGTVTEPGLGEGGAAAEENVVDSCTSAHESMRHTNAHKSAHESMGAARRPAGTVH